MTYPASVWMVEKKCIAISTGCLKLAYYPSLSRYQQLWSCFHTPNDHESIFYRFFSGSMSTNGYIIVGLGPGCFGFLLSPYERDWIPYTVRILKGARFEFFKAPGLFGVTLRYQSRSLWVHQRTFEGMACGGMCGGSRSWRIGMVVDVFHGEITACRVAEFSKWKHGGIVVHISYLN